MRKLLLVAAMAASVQGAQAADMPALRGGYSDVGVTRPMWDGFYIGGQAAQGWSQIAPNAGYNNALINSYTLSTGLTGYSYPALGRASGSKEGYGGFIGYNSQFEDVVIGIEGNYLHSSLAANSNNVFNSYALGVLTSTTQSNVGLTVKDFGSVRLRGGYMVGNFLPYAFIGGSAASVDIVQSVGVSYDRALATVGTPLPPFARATQTDKIVYGYSAGVGIDVLLIGGLFARAEYEYTRFTSTIDTSVNTVKVGLGYKF